MTDEILDIKQAAEYLQIKFSPEPGAAVPDGSRVNSPGHQVFRRRLDHGVGRRLHLVEQPCELASGKDDLLLLEGEGRDVLEPGLGEDLLELLPGQDEFVLVELQELAEFFPADFHGAFVLAVLGKRHGARERDDQADDNDAFENFHFDLRHSQYTNGADGSCQRPVKVL